MPGLSAERDYLFRHPLLREAAYQLQLPSSRARLHGLALSIMDTALPPGESGSRAAMAAELAEHAACAQELKSLRKAGRLRLAELEIQNRLLAAAWFMKRSDLNSAIAQYEKIRRHKLAAPKEAAVARWHMGVRQMALGRFESARENLADALARSLALGDAVMQTSVELELGNLAAARAERDSAEQIYQRALNQARALGNPKLESVALGGLAGLAYQRADYAGAVEGFRRALAASERAADETNVAINQMNLANALFQSDAAQEGLQMAREVCRRLESGSLSRLRMTALTNLANFLEDVGEIREAELALDSAEQLAASIGALQLAAQLMDVRARIEMRRDRWQAAADWLERAINAARENGRRLEEARCTARRGIAWARMGLKAAAQKEWDAGVAIFVSVGSREYESSLGQAFAEAMNCKEVRQL